MITSGQHAGRNEIGSNGWTTFRTDLSFQEQSLSISMSICTSRKSSPNLDGLCPFLHSSHHTILLTLGSAHSLTGRAALG